ncbi:magnesium transporter [candidate division KSB1 bacterium]|nr:magnesium transporter [candidate division KSB1 bacterium]
MEQRDIKEVVDNLNFLAEARDEIMIKNILVDLHPADIADLFHHINENSRDYIFNLLNADLASDVMAELDESARDDLIEELDENRLSEIVDEMDSDDATDLLSDLPKDIAKKVLDRIDVKDSQEVKELLRHDEDTAGGIMAKEYIAVHQDSTVDEAIQEVRKKAEEVEDVFNLYVTDEMNNLVGILSLKDLILAKAHRKVSEIMKRDIISVKTSLDQEKVANIAKKYDLVSIPVINEVGKLVGRITFDDLADVMEEEASEDIQIMAGITEEEEIRETSPFRIMRVRLPWLLVGFIGELISAYVLKKFELSLNQIIAAAFFIPIIMAMGGNAGIQASTTMVRGMATGEINMLFFNKRILREFFVSLFTGFILGLLILLTIVLWLNNMNFGLIIALALMVVIVNASLVGVIVPVILKRFNIDPAIATGPFITTSNDVLGLFIYLMLITLFLPYF